MQYCFYKNIIRTASPLPNLSSLLPHAPYLVLTHRLSTYSCHQQMISVLELSVNYQVLYNMRLSTSDLRTEPTRGVNLFISGHNKTKMLFLSFLQECETSAIAFGFVLILLKR